jgi:hypothetical protein
MRSTRKNQRKALVALALGFATAAIFATTASAGLGTGGLGTEPIPGQYGADLEAEQAMIQASSSSPITSTAEVPASEVEPSVDTGLIPGQYAPDLEAEQALIQASSPSPSTSTADVSVGQLEQGNGDAAVVKASSRGQTKSRVTRVAGQLEHASSQSAEISYLSWGATAADRGPFKVSLANQSSRDGGPVFMNGVPDGYVGSGLNLSSEGVTPTNLARAYSPIEQGASQPDGFQPQTKTVESATGATSDSLDRGDLALGFGLGLILATACAIALAMTHDRQHNRMAHS